MQKTLKIKLKQSTSGKVPAHRATVKGLGLRRPHQVRELVDTPQVRGMIKQVSYMVEIIK